MKAVKRPRRRAFRRKEWVMLESRLSVFLVGSMTACVAMVACVAEMGGAADTEGAAATATEAATVTATAATVNGNCARLEEVGMEFEDYAVPKEAGGWSSGNTSGDAIRSWDAVARTGCNTFGSPNNNSVACFYDSETKGSWKGPRLAATKTFPYNYNCTCNETTGKYQCIRQ
jgi:hypothetical protein